MELVWMFSLNAALCCAFAAADSKPFVIASNADLESFHTFSSTESSKFVTLTLEPGSDRLFIGGVDRVFAQRASDITRGIFSVVWPVSKTSSCESLPQSNEGQRCRNQIQMVQPLNSTHTLICGSNYLDPRNRMIYQKDGAYVLVQDGGDAMCSYDPDESVTSVMLQGVDGPNIFSSSRPPYVEKISLSKKMSTSYLLSKDQGSGTEQPTFVASFAANDTVRSQTMLKVYAVSDDRGDGTSSPPSAPTITQVCANDIGGQNLLSNKWTSLLKVRLRCETTDKFPLEFDLVTDMVRGRDGIIYGTFTTRHDTSRSNAVCAFRLRDVQKSFNTGDFWQNGDTVPSDPVRPGMCAYKGMNPEKPTASTSKDFPVPLLSFISSHSWIDDTIKPSYPPSEDGLKKSLSEGPLFIKSGDKFTKIAVQQETSLDGGTHDVVFVGKQSGHIHKFVTIVKGESLETIELAQYQPTTRPIISMKHSQKLRQLYVGTEDNVYQLSTSNCAAYTKSCEFCDSCSMCILSRDPGCAWDASSKECVAVEGKNKVNLKQDVYHGNPVTLCSKPPSATPTLIRVAEGSSEVLGNIVDNNPTIVATWYKVKDQSTKEKITNKPRKFRITTDGQLEIANFDSSKDSATYECQYSANSSVVSIMAYDLEATNYSPPTPVITEPPPDNGSNGDTSRGMTGGPTIPLTETTMASPLPISKATFVIGLATALAIILALAVVLLVCFLRRKRKYTPGTETSKGSKVATDAIDSPRAVIENANNNNTAVGRGLSVYNDRQDRPLLDSEEHRTPGYSDVEKSAESQPSSSQARNAKSLDNILNGSDEMEFIDEDSASCSGVARRSSLREKTGRTRVPPQRTKSMPGSALYVVYGGKKLMCSTLQRNKQGKWTIELQPNQSGMSDMTSDQDEVIDIVNDGENPVQFLPSPDRKSSDFSSTFGTQTPAVDGMKNAREAFFKKGGDREPDNDDSTVQFMTTSTPNSNVSVIKPKVAPKPARLMSDRRKPSNKEQPSRASLHSFGHNSSEDRDSDSTVKGSSVTLKPDETSPVEADVFNEGSNEHKYQHHNLHKNIQTVVPVSLSNKKSEKSPKSEGSRRHANPNSFNSSNGSFGRSSGSSDGDEQLHGCDKDVKRKNRNTPVDSPSKQSRTSQGSSSSGDYRSARSSVISEQSHDHK